jgi:hypothetical protein
MTGLPAPDFEQGLWAFESVILKKLRVGPQLALQGMRPNTRLRVGDLVILETELHHWQVSLTSTCRAT